MAERPNLVDPSKWPKPPARGGCGRDPAAGPGSCTYWFEGCPKADKRGCYQKWAHAEQDAREAEAAQHG